MATPPHLTQAQQGLQPEPQGPWDLSRQRIPAFENFEIGPTDNIKDYNIGGLARLAQYGRLNDNYDAFNQVARAYGFTPELQTQASDIGALLTNAYQSPSSSFFQQAFRPAIAAAFPWAIPALYGGQAARSVGLPQEAGEQLGAAGTFGPLAPIGRLGQQSVNRASQPGTPGMGINPQDVGALQGQAQEENQQWDVLARQIGGSQRNLAARGLGGASPEFLARVSSREAGSPQLDAYGLVQQFLNQQQG